MNRRTLLRALQRLERPAGAPDAKARDALEAKLLGDYDRRFSPRPLSSTLLRGAALTVAIVALAGATSRVPAELTVDVGARIELGLAPGQPAPDVRPIVAALGDSHRRQVQVQVRRDDSGAGLMQIELWGEAIPDPEGLEARLRALPSLHGANISVLPMEGHLHRTLGAKIGYELLRFSPSPDAQARARAKLIEAVRAEEGRDAAVDVTVTDDHGQRKVQIRVEKHRGPPDLK